MSNKVRSYLILGQSILLIVLRLREIRNSEENEMSCFPRIEQNRLIFQVCCLEGEPGELPLSVKSLVYEEVDSSVLIMETNEL